MANVCFLQSLCVISPILAFPTLLTAQGIWEVSLWINWINRCYIPWQSLTAYRQWATASRDTEAKWHTGGAQHSARRWNSGHIKKPSSFNFLQKYWLILLNTFTWFPHFWVRSILNVEDDEMPKATLEHPVNNNSQLLLTEEL